MTTPNTLCLFLCLLATACTTNGPTDNTGNLDTTPMPISIQANRHAEVAVTRAATALTEGSIGIYRTTDGGYAALDNIPYTYNGTTKQWESAAPTNKAKTIFLDHRDARLYAYYPYTANPILDGSGKKTQFALEGGRYTKEKDLMYTGWVSSVSNRSNAIPLTFRSAYSRLTLRFLNQNLPNVVIDEVSFAVSAPGLITFGQIEINAPGPITGQSKITYKPMVFTPGTDEPIATTGIPTGTIDETVDMLCIPQPLNSEMKITVTFHFAGSTQKIKSTATIPQNKLSSLQQSTQHVLPMLIKGTNIKFEDLPTSQPPAITNNDPVDPWGEDKLACYTLPPVTVNGVHVATGNVYSYKDEKMSGLIRYTFSTRSGGMYGGSRTSTFTQASIKESDPCQRAGGNWRTPTAAQLQKIILKRLKHVNSYTDPGSSTGAAGWWMGQSENSLSDSVFFPDGSYVSRDGGFILVASGGVSYITSANDNTPYLVRCVSDVPYIMNPL